MTYRLGGGYSETKFEVKANLRNDYHTAIAIFGCARAAMVRQITGVTELLSWSRSTRIRRHFVKDINSHNPYVTRGISSASWGRS